MNESTLVKEGVENQFYWNKQYCTIFGKWCAGAFYGSVFYWAGYFLHQRRIKNKEDMTASGTLDRESGKRSFKNR